MADTVGGRYRPGVSSWSLSRLITTQLYQVSPRDPATMMLTAVTLGTVALTAAWLPSRRATRVDPIVPLRAD